MNTPEQMSDEQKRVILNELHKTKNLLKIFSEYQPSREFSMAMTKLEEAIHWAYAIPTYGSGEDE